MAVAADDGHARLGAALFGADHVDDPVADVAHREELDAVVLDVALERLELQTRLVVGHRGHALGLALGRNVVVGDRKRAVGPAHRPVIGAKAGEGLRRRHLVDEVQVDIDNALAVLFVDDVGVPDLVVKRLANHGRHLGLDGVQSPAPARNCRILQISYS